MANPNIAVLSSMYGITAVDADIAATASAIVTGATDKLMKVVSLYVANIDGVNDATIDVEFYRSSVIYYIAKTVTVPADSTIVIIDESHPVYIQEADSLRLKASVAGDLSAVCCYQEIDDA